MITLGRFMQVVKCPECEGYVALESEFCQNCGHRMKVSSSIPQKTPIYPSKKANQSKMPILIILLAIIVVAIVVVAAIVVFSTVRNDHVLVEISYSGNWTGAYSDIYHTESVSGHGTRSYELTKPSQGMWIVSVVGQKSDGGSGTLTVRIIGENGNVIRQSSTSAAYGMAQVTATII
jgi:hypothetical protein